MSGSGTGDCPHWRSVHASPAPFRRSAIGRAPEATARSAHNRAAVWNSMRWLGAAPDLVPLVGRYRTVVTDPHRDHVTLSIARL
jgi:hypothetical protein